MTPIIKLTQSVSVLGPVGPSDVGDIIEYGSNIPPMGWMVCDGSAISRATYPQLFATIGTTYGPGNGTTTFNLPGLMVPVPWMAYNAIRNPEMMVAQRGSAPLNVGSGFYGLDGWMWGWVISTWAASMSQLVADIPADTSGNNWYPHTTYALRTTTTSGQASFSAGQYTLIQQVIEGLMAEKLKDNPTSISLLVRSSVTGTFTVALRNAGASYSYCIPVTIPVANVWQRVALPNIPTFTALATFPNGPVACYSLTVCLGAGSTFTTGTNNAWVAGNFVAATTQTNLTGVAGTFDFTLVQHEPNPVCTTYIKRDLAVEMALSTRYLNYYPNQYLGWVATPAWTANMGLLTFPPMRAAPTLAAGATFNMANGPLGTPQLAVSNLTSGNITNSANNWATTAYNSNYCVLNGAFLTAEL